MSISGILSAIFSGGTSSAPALSDNPVTALQVAEKTEVSAVATQAKQPETAHDIAAFLAAVGAAKTPTQLLNNPAAMKVILTVNGLADQIGYTVLAQQALLSNPAKTNSLANQLSSTNNNWLTAAQAYEFSTQGLSVIKNPATLKSIANAYAQQTWMTSLNAATPGLANALNFRTMASSVSSVNQILGNATLRTVVTTTLGIPEQIAYQPLEAQQKAITSAMDISQFKSQSFVEKFAQRYLLAAASAAAANPASGPTLESLAVQSGLVA